MSDWEDIFGEGVSAESVIDGIDASWEHTWREEQEQAKKRNRGQRKAELTAYRGSEELKTEFIRHLRSNAPHLKEPPAEGGLLSLMYPADDGFSKLEDHYRIPQSLAYILNRVQFETHRFRVGWSPSGRLWKVGTTGFELDAV